MRPPKDFFVLDNFDGSFPYLFFLFLDPFPCQSYSLYEAPFALFQTPRQSLKS